MVMSWWYLRDHTLPLFLVYITEFDGGKEPVTSAGAEIKAGEEITAPKGWSFLNQGSGEVEEGGGGDNTSGISQGKMITFVWQQNDFFWFTH